MTMTYETSARKLERPEIDVINYSDVHPHDAKKVIAFSGAQQADYTPVPHPSMAARHRRMARRADRRQKLLVAYPRYLCVAMLVLFFYLRLAVFPEAALEFNFLWIGAYALAGISFVFARMLRPSGGN